MTDAPGLFATPSAAPAGGLPRRSRYTVANGAIYLGAGAALYVLPEPAVEALWVTALDGWDLGLTRALGVAVAIIGWFYVFGGRTGSPSFALATVVDRVAVPFLLVPLWAAGHAPAVPVFRFSVLDPVLAMGAVWIWRADRR